jgi:hypothetical protein
VLSIHVTIAEIFSQLSPSLSSNLNSIMSKYPDDADGSVLADLEASGIDMSAPLQFEFPVAVPDEESAEKTYAAMVAAGYDSVIEFDEGEPDEDGEIDPDDDEFGPCWTVYANVVMVPITTNSFAFKRTLIVSQNRSVVLPTAGEPSSATRVRTKKTRSFKELFASR